MATAADPLAGLRPVRLPAEAPAPLLDLLALSIAAGILVALAILLAPRVAAAISRRCSPRRRLAAALAAARVLPAEERLAAQASALRAYVAAVAGEEAARAQGQAWLARLDEAFATTAFTAGPGRLYGETLYRPADTSEVSAAEAALSALAAGRRVAPC
jgi:hypothetical protein